MRAVAKIFTIATLASLFVASAYADSGVSDSVDQERHHHAAAHKAMMSKADPAATSSMIDIVLGTQDKLRMPMALSNKNTIATGNNVLITRSNIIFTRGDQRSLVDTIQDMVQNSQDQDDKTLADAIRLALGFKPRSTDNADMDRDSDVDTKAVDQQIKSVLGCRRNNNRIMLRKCIRALVRMKMPATMSNADADELVYGGKRTTVVAGGRALPIGRGGAAVVKRTTVVGGRTYPMRRFYPEAEASDDDNDDDELVYAKKKTTMTVVAGRTYPEGDDSEDAEASDANEYLMNYRMLFRYPYAGSFRYGWRYPITYWNTYGRQFYPGTCGFGQAIGPYFFC